ncbi:MAG: hypothetical protein KAX39_06675 [candidate division Zixibacteria bacterium]|nr:hypothetical protein [candidate division Zixibacteria bacterium]
MNASHMTSFYGERADARPSGRSRTIKDFWKKLFARQGSNPSAKRMKERNFHVMIGQNFGGSKAKKRNFPTGSVGKDFPISPVSKRTSYLDQGELLLPQSSLYDSSFRIRLYRFLRDSIPVLNSAIWTWTRICASPSHFELKGPVGDPARGGAENPAKGEDDPKLLDNASEVLKNLDRRIYQHSFQKFGGADALLMQFFGSLFTDGAVCGELVLTPSRDKLDKFYFIDPATIRFKLKDDTSWELYQEVDGVQVKLNPASTFYLGLDPDADDPRGKSILSSIPFVARVEERLLEDMQKTMHNAGYHRLHVTIKPPERFSGESDETYVSRANKYFEDTVEMMKELAPEDNPITWNDVGIEYIGPSGHVASSNYWYINHKALVEDICSGVHLDPFMLGYSYGPTRSWAQFKYELILRNVISIQRLAKRFMEWIRNIELALWGIPLESVHHFDNRKFFGMLEQREAEKIHLENIIRKKEAGFISEDQAKREIESEE